MTVCLSTACTLCKFANDRETSLQMSRRYEILQLCVQVTALQDFEDLWLVLQVIFLGPIQTWCSGSVLGHRHHCECSILVEPVQKREHNTWVWALSPKVVFRHRTWARALVCTRFHQPCFYPCFPVI